MRQAKIWSHGSLLIWRIYVSFGRNELMSAPSQNCTGVLRCTLSEDCVFGVNLLGNPGSTQWLESLYSVTISLHNPMEGNFVTHQCSTRSSNWSLENGRHSCLSCRTTIHCHLPRNKYRLVIPNLLTLANRKTGGRLNKKDGLTRYGDSHVKDKTS